MQDTLQPRWMHVIETKDRSLDDVMKDMESKTRQILRKNERSAITTREITETIDLNDPPVLEEKTYTVTIRISGNDKIARRDITQYLLIQSAE